MTTNDNQFIDLIQLLLSDTEKEAAVVLLKEQPELLEARNSRGMTALMEVSLLGNAEAAEFLIQSGAQVNAKSDKEGRTAMHFAAEHGHVDAYCILKDNGGDDTQPDIKRDTPRNVLDWYFSPVGSAMRAAREK
ncbi:MAG: ankyrin repeat domain-containing protein [Candidatus Methylacidiphilales bacterium]|nr:ankyrin repeat domain-containing protein [Candidatus Methylacidiphilales bacterium]